MTARSSRPAPRPRSATAASTRRLPARCSGKIALIRRGSAAPPAPTCGFYNKAINAQNAGAIAVVIYNNVAGALNPTVAPVPAGAPPVNIPVAAITAADGAAIFSNLATDHTLTWTDQVLETPLATAGLISDFQLVRHRCRARPEARPPAAPAARSTRPGPISSSVATTRSAARIDVLAPRRRTRGAATPGEAQQHLARDGADAADEHGTAERV